MIAPLTDEQIAAIRADYEAGVSKPAIAAKYGLKFNAVRQTTRDIPRDMPANRQKVFKCAGCPLVFYDRKNPRVYCTHECRIAHGQRQQLERLAEFEWIAGTDTWDNIANRVGFAGSKQLRDWLRRIGHDAWADRITADVERPRQGRWAA